MTENQISGHGGTLMKLEPDITIVTIGACHLSRLCHIVI